MRMKLKNVVDSEYANMLDMEMFIPYLFRVRQTTNTMAPKIKDKIELNDKFFTLLTS